MNTNYYLTEIAKERARQDEKWGEQNHHPLMWFSIIGEEYGEMLKAFNEYSFDNGFDHFNNMQREAIQIAASCVAMLECIKRMENSGFVPEGRIENDK